MDGQMDGWTYAEGQMDGRTTNMDERTKEQTVTQSCERRMDVRTKDIRTNE